MGQIVIANKNSDGSKCLLNRYEQYSRPFRVLEIVFLTFLITYSVLSSLRLVKLTRDDSHERLKRYLKALV